MGLRPFWGHSEATGKRVLFSPEQRERSGRWVRAEIAAGRREPARRCVSCQQTAGILHLHSEDYSEPFGPHIGRWPLCYACHMTLHVRHRYPEGFVDYQVVVLRGMRLAPLRSIAVLCSFLSGSGFASIEKIEPSPRRPFGPFPWEAEDWTAISMKVSGALA